MACASAPVTTNARSNPSTVVADELREARKPGLLTVLQQLRPAWFVGGEATAVYLDRQRLTDLGSLATIATLEVARVRRFRASTADPEYATVGATWIIVVETIK
jgi:hypothetical protein